MPPDAGCQHATLALNSSPHARELGFVLKTDRQRLAASSISGRVDDQLRTSTPPSQSTYPTPLILPGDALEERLNHSGQTAQSWSTSRWLNPVTPQRRTLYVAEVPVADDSVKHVRAWTQPTLGRNKAKSAAWMPSAGEVQKYVASFYHPLPIKRLSTLAFTAWPDSVTSRGTPPAIALHDTTTGAVTKLTSRKSPAKSPYPYQLATKPLIDALIAALPSDAYAIVLLLAHDLYEDAGDDFIVGRAYGASRIALVSMARYSPVLDVREGLDPIHAWPGSHCAAFVAQMCSGSAVQDAVVAPKSSPMGAAMAAHRAEQGREDARRRWLNRVCRTVSHELGHCFGMGHCIFYACIMQGTSGVTEDAEQPGYLCPVDLTKVLRATGASEEAWLGAMAGMCEELGPGGGFGALAAWCRARLAEVQH